MSISDVHRGPFIISTELFSQSFLQINQRKAIIKVENTKENNEDLEHSTIAHNIKRE